MMFRGPLIALPALLASALAVSVASADIGVGVGAAPLILGGPAIAGQTYSMPPLYVVNTGTETARYSITVQRISEGEAQPVPPDWISLGDNEFLLAAQGSAQVAVTLSVPDGTAPGAYLTNLVASAAPPAQPPGGAALGAAAAAKVTFSVAPPLGPSIPLPWGTVFVPWPSFLPWPLPPWVGIAAAAGAVLIALGVVLKLLGVSVQLERR